MIKTFPLIPLNNYLYMVDKEAKVAEDQWSYCERTKSLGLPRYPACGDCRLILASNDPSLKLPLLPTVEETVDQLKVLADIEFPKEDWQDQMIRTAYILGYKAASKKKYSEEDIMTFYKHVKTHTFQEAMDHLNKQSNLLPTAIEVETECVQTGNWYCTDCDKEAGIICQEQHMVRPQYNLVPKVDKTNTVIGRYIWEK